MGIRYAVAQEDGAGARPHDDAAVDAVVDLHLRAHVEDVDGAPLARSDADAHAKRLAPLGAARAGRLQVGLA